MLKRICDTVASNQRRISRVGALGLLVAIVVGCQDGNKTQDIESLPDIGDPFDVKEFTSLEVPDEENAYVMYRQAAAKYEEAGPVWPESLHEIGEHLDLSSTSVELRSYFGKQREALKLWRQGADRADALPIKLSQRTGTNQDFETTAAIRYLIYFPLIESLRLQDRGEMKRAWSSLRAMLHCSRHTQLNGGLTERALAFGYYGVAVKGIRQWADDERTTLDLLEQALTDVREINDGIPPFSRTIKISFLEDMNSIDEMHEKFRGSIDTPEEFRKHWARRKGQQVDEVEIDAAFLAHEPELSRRVARILYGSWLANVDTFWNQDRPVTNSQGKEIMTIDELAKWLGRSVYFRDVIAPYPPSRGIMERFEQRALLTILALQVYRRKHGEFPDKLNALTGNILEVVPQDPARAAPLLYERRHGGAVVWSVGIDGNNDGGTRQLDSDFQPRDYVLETSREVMLADMPPDERLKQVIEDGDVDRAERAITEFIAKFPQRPLPLHDAVRQHEERIVRMMIDAGADVNQRGRTALDTHLRNCH